ncbi:MAG: VOC family protein, partial [Microthrixaceae bacterium]
MTGDGRLDSLADLLRDVIQVAYVTDDIDAAVQWLQDSFGTTECQKMYGSSLGGSVVVDGEPAQEWVIDTALVNAGPTNIELIRPVSGAVAMYREAIRPGAPATFHHLGVQVDDF